MQPARDRSREKWLEWTTPGDNRGHASKRSPWCSSFRPSTGPEGRKKAGRVVSRVFRGSKRLPMKANTRDDDDRRTETEPTRTRAERIARRRAERRTGERAVDGHEGWASLPRLLGAHNPEVPHE